MKNTTPKRWEIAQNSEIGYWEGFTRETLLKQEAERHEKKAKILEHCWENFLKLDKNIKILQIGCGPEDVINYLSIGKKYAIDPLADFYKKKFGLDYKKISFSKARAEKLPFKDNYFDIVILANVLDHVEQPETTLLEVKRVLKDNGIFHFENLFYQKNFLALARIWGFFKKIFTRKIFNIHHPFMFSLQDIKALFSKEFTILEEGIGKEAGECENMKELRKQKLKNPKLTVKIPAIFGLYGIINYTAICRKR